MANKNIPITERFWTKVNKDGPIPQHCPELGNCWLWTGFIYPTGHGQFHMSSMGRDVRAQRAAWLLFVGELETHEYVCHRCHNPACVRLEHLYKGTHQTNMRDKIATKAYRYENSPYHKLSWRTVREIRKLIQVLQTGSRTKKYEQLAKKFSVSSTMIRRVVNNEFWEIEDDPEGTVQ